MLQLGDYVSAEYVEGISGQTATLNGLVIGLGEWEGHITVSVAGLDSDGTVSTLSSSILPVRGLASRDSELARWAWDQIYRAATGDRLRAKLEHIWVEEMGM